MSPTPSFGGWVFGQDFNLSGNPDGAWSYGYRDTVASSALTLMPNNGSFSGISFWYLAGTGLPSVGVNQTSDPFNFPGGLPLGPEQGMLHPGDDAALADLSSVVRWTAPTAGSYSIDATFTGLDGRGIDVTAYVLMDGSVLRSSAITSVGGSMTYSGELSLNAGQAVDFLVATRGTPGDKDWTGLQASIQSAPAPEPSTFILGCSGWALVVGFAWRRRKGNRMS
jgi:hypothetical protein